MATTTAVVREAGEERGAPQPSWGIWPSRERTQGSERRRRRRCPSRLSHSLSPGRHTRGCAVLPLLCIAGPCHLSSLASLCNICINLHVACVTEIEQMVAAVPSPSGSCMYWHTCIC